MLRPSYRKSLALLAATCLAATLALVMLAVAQEINNEASLSSTTSTTPISPQETSTLVPGDLEGVQDEEEQEEGEEEEQQQKQGSGLMSRLLSPIRATFARAKRMMLGGLGMGLGGARDLVVSGFDELQTRTFKIFMRAYNKTYSVDELPRRMALFFERRKLIEKSMRDFAAGALTFSVRENAFSDWDEAELGRLAGVSPPASLDEMTDEERALMLEEGARDSTARADDQSPLERRLVISDESGRDQEFIELTAPLPAGNEAATGNEIAVDDQEAQLNVSRASFGSPDDDDTNLIVRAPERIPATLDWRQSGCVAQPINQMKCGACYAIATVGALESQRCINRVKSSPVLSPQQVVDCSRAYKNYGCDGGWPTRVLKYLQDTRVMARESCYPFVRRANTCKLRQVAASGSSCTVAASAMDGSRLSYKVLNNERDILYHVAKTGPVITVMSATDRFLYYSDGIFDDPKCTRKRDDVDHAIVIVGYGRENNMDYWLIKNSWGTTDWGLAGYGKFRRGRNACSIGHWGWVITG